MEAFSLLKYWRSNGVLGGASGDDGGINVRTTNTTTIVTAVTEHATETDDDDGGDDGPFFDLEFAVQDDDDEEEEDSKDDKRNQEEEVENENDVVESGSDEEEEDGEREFNFTISSNSSGNDRTDQNLTLSPSDDLFFKGRLVPIEASSLQEPNSKPPQFPVSLLKSATKFRVFMLGFKKSRQNASEKVEKTEANNGSGDTTTIPLPPKQQQKQETEKEKEKQNKLFTVKLKVEEVPIVSLFNSSSRKTTTTQKQSSGSSTIEDSAATTEEKKFSKDVMQKYLKKVKPLYVRVSKRYGEKLKFTSGQLNLASVITKSVQSAQSPPSTAAGHHHHHHQQKSNPPPPTAEKSSEVVVVGESQVKSQKQTNIPERLRVVCKHLGKSRSASSAAVAAAPPQPPGPVVSRRDDSLLQQQDSIQSAILHCKRSFNASRDSESSSSMLPRSVSDPSHQKS